MYTITLETIGTVFLGRNQQLFVFIQLNTQPRPPSTGVPSDVASVGASTRMCDGTSDGAIQSFAVQFVYLRTADAEPWKESRPLRRLEHALV